MPVRLHAGTKEAGLSVKGGCVGIFFLTFLVVTDHMRGVLETLKRRVMFDADFRRFCISRWIAGVGSGEENKAGLGRGLFS